MPLLSTVLIVLVALLHGWFLVLEMFLWQRPPSRKTFRTTEEFAAASAGLAANQGLYNGFLAAGLLWALLLGDGGYAIKLFFLGCVIVAGLFGAATVNRRILMIQALPAAFALVATVLAKA